MTGIPDDLRARPQWVAWRTESRGDKRTKVPYQAVAPARRASSTDPDTWSACTYAVKAVERGAADGIGFTFTADDPFVGIDLDECVTNGHVDPRAMDLVRAMDSYTEITPSGKGLHVWVRGTWGAGRRTSSTSWRGEIEVYDRGRYFTVTGRHLDGTPDQIHERQKELDDLRAAYWPPDPAPERTPMPAVPVALDDRELLEKATAASNGGRFGQLWRGDTGGHGNDASRADLALCDLLAFWTGGDADRMDRLFRSSGLMRPKWDSPRGDSTYGRQTIDKALNGRTEFYGAGVAGGRPSMGAATLPPPSQNGSTKPNPGVAPPATPATLRPCDVAAMLTTEPEPVDWLIEGVVARGTLTLLAGREKEGKSLLAMACAARGATGGGILAGIRVEPLRVAILDAENGHRELHRRLRSLGLRAEHADRIDIYEAVGHDLRRHLHEIESVLEASKPDLVILDSWRSLWGGDENDSGEVSRVLDPVRNLMRAHNAGAVLIHHMRKSGGYRGSSAIGSSVENVLELARHDEDPDRRRRRLRNPSCRYEQEADDRWLRIEADREIGALLIDETDPFHPSAPARENAADQLLAALNGHPTTWADWARDAGLDPKDRTARRARDELRAHDRVKQDAGGHWTAGGAA
jgi:putative DNA primase/helicase